MFRSDETTSCVTAALQRPARCATEARDTVAVRSNVRTSLHLYRTLYLLLDLKNATELSWPTAGGTRRAGEAVY